MMKFIQLLAFVIVFTNQLFAQGNSSPVKLLQSEDFESPGRHDILSPIPYGEKGIIQVNNRGIKSFNFQLFSNDLRFVKEKTVEPEKKLSENATNPRFVKVGSKTYLFVRDVYRDRDKEGVSCLEFNADKLDFEPKDKKLFETSDKVAYNGLYSFSNASFEDENKISFGSYKMDISKNDKAVMFTYRLRPEKRNDRMNKDVIGMQVFDQQMEKIWGGEMTMPYTEAKMDNLSFIVSDDAKVYILAKVYEGETPRESVIVKFQTIILSY